MSSLLDSRSARRVGVLSSTLLIAGAAASLAANVGVAEPTLSGGYPVLQETDGHVHWPLGEIVTPQLLPLPLGLATITYWLGQVALTFQVE